MAKIITVDFRSDTLFAVEEDDSTVFVALKSISDAVGLKWHGQLERVKRDPILSEGIRVIRIPSPGGLQEMVCLRLDLVNGWLFTIDESRIKDEEIRQKVLGYKRECYAVLCRHFDRRAEQPKSELGEPPPLSERPWAERPAAERHLELRTITKIARHGNNALAWWYITEVAKIAAFPRHLQPAWWQTDLDLRESGGRSVTIVVPPGGETH